MTRSLITLLLLLGCAVPTTTSAAEKPNFVLIFIDDMGYGDIGPYGSKVNKTPQLDRMAAEGMKLTSFYAAPVCSASRAQLMTGSYAPRVSVPGVFFPAGPNGLHPDERTVAEYLKQSGYATMCIGKWHLGDQREFLPTRQGFDHYIGFPYSNDMARQSATDGRLVLPLMRNEEVEAELENEEQRRITRRYTEEAVKFIEANKTRPFFLYLPHTAMHVPLYPHQDFVGTSANGKYGDWVAEVDWSVGQILDTLRKHSLETETLVIFTSDNGPWMSRGKDGGVATPLRGSKGGTLEGGVREPTIAWWPGKIKAGAVADCVAGTTDILPTFVSLAGGTLNRDVTIDGFDLSPVLLGEADKTARKAWYYYRGTKLMAVRSGPWKLAIAPQTLGMGIREKPEDLQSNLRLYNLADDIGETNDVAQQHPDVVKDLQRLAENMKADIGSGKAGPGVRPAGRVESPITLFPSVPKKLAKAAAKPIDWNKALVGESYPASAAPQIAGRPFSIEARISGSPPTGVVISHGGSVVGYSLYVDNGRVTFAIHPSSSAEIRRVSIPWKGSEETIHAELTEKGIMSIRSGAGEESTALNGQIKGQPQEDLCIGFDAKKPVDPDGPNGSFQGELLSVRVSVGSKS